jgi:macrolide transport system ATP-binding/permease protein
MRALRGWIIRLLGLLKQQQNDNDLAEEIESHLAMHIEDNLHSGMSPEEARRNALIKLGGLDKTFEEYRDRRSFSWMSELQRNFRFAGRMVWKQKTLSLIVIGLLAFASAVNTTIFSVYNFLYLRSFPYPDNERMVFVDLQGGYDYYDLHFRQHENRSFQALGSYNLGSSNYSCQGTAHPVDVLIVSPDMASVFQYRPVLGRNFLKSETESGQPKVVMLSYRFWQREFGGSTSVIGKTLKLDGELHTVVGVLPSNGDFPSFPKPKDLWVLYQKGSGNLPWAYGRLKQGTSIEQAQQELALIHKSILETRAYKMDPPKIQFLRDGIFGKSNTDPAIIMLLFSSGLLLLIVCLNIAGMMLARSESRAQEIGIRTALGSSRAGIVRQFLTESLLLAFFGVFAGLLLGQLLLKLIVFSFQAAIKSALPSWVRLTPDIPLLAFCVALTGIATVIFGLAPALHASNVNVQQSLHEAGSRTSASGSKRRLLKTLVVWEIAFTFVLLVAAGLLLRGWQKMLAIDPGFRAENVFTFQLRLPPSYGRSDFFERMIDSLRQVPGITAASGSNSLPMGGSNKFYFDVAGITSNQADSMILMRWIFSDYFKVLEIPLLAGRDFTMEEARNPKADVVIIDQSFARRYWPGANPIGKRIRIRQEGDWQGQWRTSVGLDRWMTVIGITRDVSNFGLDRAIEPGAYFPCKKWPVTWYHILVRSNLGSATTFRSIQSQLHKLDSDIGMFSPMALTDIVDQSTFDRRVLSITMAVFAISALLIAAAGVYGIVNYTVSRRTHEIGIRMALGATRTQVIGMVIGGGARLLTFGAILGMVGSIMASQALRSMLFGITSFDFPTYLVAGGVLIAAVGAATLFPAKRAASIEPIRALRSE